MEQNKEELAQLMHDETAKTVADATTEIVRTIDYINDTIAA